MRQRGYNQAECFAKALSEKTGIRMAKGLVRRVKNTSPLKTMGYVERRNCLEGAFQVADSIVPVSYTHLDVYKRQAIEKAQEKIEANNFGIRKNLLE